MNLPRETIAVAVDGENQGLRLVLQYRPQLGNAARDDRFGHDAARPDTVHQLILGDQFAGVANQLGEHLQRFRLDLEQQVPTAQLQLLRLQFERTKAIQLSHGFLLFGGGDSIHGRPFVGNPSAGITLVYRQYSVSIVMIRQNFIMTRSAVST